LLESNGQTAALTRREREVARLAAANRSSREIADRLGLSVRTVDNYLSRAYAKLGVSGRTELAPHLGVQSPAGGLRPQGAG
jgi:DNA-binding CsgD family transcriptional regulator